MTLSGGYSIMKLEYDDAGLVAVESYFGENGEPVLCSSGFHRVERTWKDKNHAKNEAWFDTEGKPTAPGSNVFVRRERDYDEDGNVIGERLYDAEGDIIQTE